MAQKRSARVVFVSLASVRDAAFVARAIAEALGMADVTAVDLPRRVHAACHHQVTLLVADNFEQVLDAVCSRHPGGAARERRRGDRVDSGRA